MEESKKLLELLYKFFEKRHIEVEIKDYNFDFEFVFDIRSVELMILNRILTSLTDLNKSVLTEYHTEIELYDGELVVFFDRIDEDINDDDIEDY